MEPPKPVCTDVYTRYIGVKRRIYTLRGVPARLQEPRHQTVRHLPPVVDAPIWSPRTYRLYRGPYE
jgi:hypothetical protein